MAGDAAIYRFGVFEFDLRSGRLTKYGQTIRLQPQPMRLLTLLLRRPGDLVTREQIRSELWSADVFVDFDHNLNICVHKLRQALCDDGDVQRFIETRAKLGYRFIAPVEIVPSPNQTTVADSPSLAADAPVAMVPSLPTQKSYRMTIPASLLAVVVLLGLGGWYFARPLASEKPRAIQFHSRDWVLITDFENRTGETVLDGTLETALRRELSNSRFVSVAPIERVHDTLRLMKRAPDTRVDAAVGREICLRDGGIQAMLSGRIEKLAGTYVVTVFTVNPASGVIVAGEEQRAKSQDELLAATHLLANSILRDLGEHENEIRETETKLSSATTPSLQALYLYSKADNLMRNGGQARQSQAEQLLRRALEDDPQFASALNLLAWSVRNQGRSESEYFPISDKALQYSNFATEREAQFIRASDDLFHHNTDRAIAAFEAVADAYPDDYWSASNAWSLCMNLGREDEAVRWAQHLTEIQPNDPSVLSRAWITLDAQPQLAAKFRQRLVALKQAGIVLPADIDSLLRWDLEVLEPAEQGNLQGAMAAAARLEPDLAPPTNRFLPPLFALSLGQLRKANSLAFVDSWSVRLTIASQDGNTSALKKLAQYSNRMPLDTSLPPALLARSGFPVEAALMHDRFAGKFTQWKIGEAFTKGEIDFAQGKFSEAIPLLRTSVEHFAIARQMFLFFAAEDLARALDRSGQTKAAIDTLEPLEKDPRFNPQSSLAPGTARLLLAQLYRKVGRIDDAKRVESELLALWKYADPDFPPLIQLKQQASQPVQLAQRPN